MVVGPRNTAVIVGRKMEMKCQVETNWTVRQWSVQRTLNQTNEVLVSMWNDKNRIFDAHFGVDVNDFGSAEILYANSITLEDAGIYTCGVQQGSKQPEYHTAMLLVFGKFSSYRYLRCYSDE